MPLDEAALVASCMHAAVAELLYDDGERLRFEVAVPLVWSDRPALALTYGDTDLADRLDGTRVVLLLSDSRLARKGWVPLAASVRMEVTEDPEGKLFQLEGLLGQELVKHPPSRLLADTPLLRREYWWYMPRLLVRATTVETVWPISPRTGAEGLLGYGAGGGLSASTVRVDDWDADRIDLRPVPGDAPWPPPDGPATLATHDFSIPDLDRRCAYQVRGSLVEGRLAVRDREGTLALEGPRKLLRRLRRLREAERACRAGLTARGH
jgi:hypothetical protein